MIELIRNMKSRRKLVPRVRCGISQEALCDLETGVNWWLEKSDQPIRMIIIIITPLLLITPFRSSGSRRLHCDETTQVTRRRRLEELICRGNISYSKLSCTLSHCSDLRIWSELEDLRAATTARARVFLMCQGAI